MPKLDKENREVYLAAKEIAIPEDSNVLILNSAQGFLGISLASAHRDAQFFLYEPNLINQALAKENKDISYSVKNVKLLSEGELRELEDRHPFSHVIYSVAGYTALDILTYTIAYGASLLKDKGEFILITNKKRGAERHGKILGETTGGKVEIVTRGSGGYRIFRAVPAESSVGHLDLRKNIEFQILGHTIRVQTEAGLFSKDRLDEGTRFLLEAINPNHYKRLLDVGCGWGAIGLTAAILNPEGAIVMTDVDTRALRVARDNLSRHNLQDRVEVVATASLREIAGNFDLILSNPPFHANERELTTLFEGVKDKLDKKGVFYFVVEQSYVRRLTNLANEIFRNLTEAHKDQEKGYSILSVRK